MNKPTLDDFIKDPDKAILNGYLPDFMSIGSMIADQFSFSNFNELILQYWQEILYGKVIELPRKFLILAISAIIFFSIPLFFPIWWVIIWIVHLTYSKKELQKIKKQEDRLNKSL